MKTNKTTIFCNKSFAFNGLLKKSIKLIVKKQIAKKVTNPIKFIGLDLFKKLASIVSFVIFASVKINKL